jgi:hypothetical protein
MRKYAAKNSFKLAKKNRCKNMAVNTAVMTKLLVVKGAQGGHVFS